MKAHFGCSWRRVVSRGAVAGIGLLGASLTAMAATLTNPIVFVTQPPIPRELNSSVSNTFLSVVTVFGNQQADTAHAARGGDLWLMTTNSTLVNLTRKAGFGTNGIQHGHNLGIDVRDPQIHWSGRKILFSMVVGSPTNGTDTTSYFWQLHELTNLDAVIANTNTKPAIVRVPFQPAGNNNVTPCYATDDRIIFMSDMPYGGQTNLYPPLDEYKGNPTLSGTYSLNPTNGDLRMIEHLPSGAFNPFVDSFGRLILTRWDHLSQDPNAVNDILKKGTNGAFNWAGEAANAGISTNILETFPEPRKFDTNYCALLGVSGNDFNLFLPWALDQNGGNEEVLNHVGRQEMLLALNQSFTGDTNLVTFTNLAQRVASGVDSANTNQLGSFFQIVEDPRTNGLYWGVAAQDISIFGGAHAAGQILTLTGGPGVNPTNMRVTFITPPAGAVGPNSQGLFRNPLPMSDGSLIAAYTPTTTSTNFGWDTNLGTASLPISMYSFRLYRLANGFPYYTTNSLLTGGISNTVVYFDGSTLVTNSATQWELQPVEVRSRSVPVPVQTGVASVEQQVFAEENVDLAAFQADIAARGLALVVSRNVTARDSADKQQPYNLRVPGGASSVANAGKVYNITHLQYLQADYLRGYTWGTPNAQPGRRILATPMHDAAEYNYVSSASNAPPGGTELMSDGSQATFIPANRAITWQLTGVTNESVVKERYWISFRPGEVRTCANCHGINAQDQIGRPPPTNAPLALRQLLRLWRTNAASAYSLTVSNGTGTGSFGAGSLLTLSANAAPSGTGFHHWSGQGVASPNSATTAFTMPGTNTLVTAVYTNIPAPVIGGCQLTGTNLSLTAQGGANQVWVLQASTNFLNWLDVQTNLAGPGGSVQFGLPVGPGAARQFFRLKSP